MKRFFAVRLLALFAILAGLMSAGRVNAQSTSGPFTTSTPISATTTDYTGTLTFAKFNHSLGSLLSVTIAIQNTLSGTITVTNGGSSTINGYMFPFINVGFTDSSGNLPTPFVCGLPTAGALYATVLTPKVSFSGIGPGGYYTSGMLSSTMTATTTYDLVNYPGVVNEFSGASGSTITLSLSTGTGCVLSNNGGGSCTEACTLAITGTVTYTYAP